jgi:hypothetical protein
VAKKDRGITATRLHDVGVGNFRVWRASQTSRTVSCTLMFVDRTRGKMPVVLQDENQLA